MSTHVLGRYHIIRELARSNDIVYEAMDPKLGKKIALKELHVPPNLAGQPRYDRIQRFTREARAAARLNHPNIVHVHDHGNVEGRYYIAMEFLQGQSLRDVMRQRGILPPAESLRIAAAVADALEYAHRHGVVHRDIKPDNVHLEPDGRVVITDFGIARLTFEPTLTSAGQIFGTPSYMSPEQVSGKDVGPGSDLFSLGVMLYEMTSGRKPFTGDSVITITYNILNMEPPPPSAGPPGLDAVIRHAIAKDPVRRYKSAGDFADDLRALAAGRPPRHANAAAHLVVVPTGMDASAVRSGRPPGAPPPAMPPPLPGFPRVGGQPGPAGGRQTPPPPLPRPFGGNGAGPAARVMVPVIAPGPPRPGGAMPLSRPAERSPGTQNILWLLGWFGIAAVIGLIVLALVWASVNAFERNARDQATAAVVSLQKQADQAYSAAKYEEALNIYKAILQQTQGERAGVARRSAAAAAVEIAKQHLGGGRLPQAEEYCRQALQLDPNHAVAYITLGQVYARQNRYDEAIGQLDQAALLAGRGSRKDDQANLKAATLWKADTLLRDGQDRRKRGDFEGARERFRRILAETPDTDYAANAKAELAQLGGGTATSADAPPGNQPLPGPASEPMPTAPGDQPQRPEGWEDMKKYMTP